MMKVNGMISFEDIYKLNEQTYKNMKMLYHISYHKFDNFKETGGAAHHNIGVDNVMFFSHSKEMVFKFARGIFLGEDYFKELENNIPEETGWTEENITMYLYYVKPMRPLKILNPTSKKDYNLMSAIDKKDLDKISNTHYWGEIEEWVSRNNKWVLDNYDGFVTAQYEFSNLAIFDAHKKLKILKIEEVSDKDLKNIEYSKEWEDVYKINK